MHVESEGARPPAGPSGLRLLLSVALTALCVAACGGSSGSGSSAGSSGTAQSLLKQTFAAGHTVASGVLGLAVTIGPTGSGSVTGPISLSLSGPFQSHGSGTLPSSDFTVAITRSASTARSA